MSKKALLCFLLLIPAIIYYTNYHDIGFAKDDKSTIKGGFTQLKKDVKSLGSATKEGLKDGLKDAGKGLKEAGKKTKKSLKKGSKKLKKSTEKSAKETKKETKSLWKKIKNKLGWGD